MVNKIVHKNPIDGSLDIRSIDERQSLSVYLNRFPGSVIMNTSDFPTDGGAFSKSWQLNPTPLADVKLATTGILPDSPAYANNIITSTGEPLNLTVDSVITSNGNRILVQNQASSTENGIYTVTNDGLEANTNWKLTRSTDFVQIMTPLFANSAIHIIDGTTNGNTTVILDSTINTIDTDNVNFSPGTVSNSVIVVDMSTARESKIKQLRSKRNTLFNRIDQLFIEATSQGKSTIDIEIRQYYLRNITETPAIDAATTIAEINAIEIDEWVEPDISNAVPLDYRRTEVDSATYTLTDTECIIGVTYTSTAAVTVTLPSVPPGGHKRYIVKDEHGNASVNNITIITTGDDTIDGGSSYTLNTDYGSIMLYNNGSTSWFLI
jgi:hypothetical protein